MHVPTTAVYPPQVALTLPSIVTLQMHATLPIAIAVPDVFSRMLPAMIITFARTTVVMRAMVANTPTYLATTTTIVQRISAIPLLVAQTHKSNVTITLLARHLPVIPRLVVSTRTTLIAVTIMTTIVTPMPATTFLVVQVFPSVATIIMHALTILATPRLGVLTPQPTAHTIANVSPTTVIPRADALRLLLYVMTQMPVHMIIVTITMDVSTRRSLATTPRTVRLKPATQF